MFPLNPMKHQENFFEWFTYLLRNISSSFVFQFWWLGPSSRIFLFNRPVAVTQESIMVSFKFFVLSVQVFLFFCSIVLFPLQWVRRVLTWTLIYFYLRWVPSSACNIFSFQPSVPVFWKNYNERLIQDIVFIFGQNCE